MPVDCLRFLSPCRKALYEGIAFTDWLFFISSACVTSVLRTYYTWKTVQSPDKSYNIVPMGLWVCAELSAGICISCLPVTPKLLKHIGPKLSSALTTLKSRSTKASADSGSVSPAKLKSSQRAEGEKLKHPGFNLTLTSLFSSGAKKEDDHELYDQQSVPKREYALLHEESEISMRDDTPGELSQVPPVNLSTMRDDLERGFGRP